MLATADPPGLIRTTVQVSPAQLDELTRLAAEIPVSRKALVRQLLATALRRGAPVIGVPDPDAVVVKISVSLSEGMREAVDLLAAQANVSRSEMVRRLLATALFLTSSRG